MQFYGVDHTVDVFKIRCQMVALDGARGRAPVGTTNIDAWARRMGVSHMTLRRLLRGEPVRIKSLTDVLEALHLTFADVCTPGTAMQVAAWSGTP